MSRDDDPFESARHDPYAPLRLVHYRRYLLGGVLASAAAEMQVVALGWELYERTASATALGLVGLSMFVPMLLMTLPAGHMADRISRQKLMVTSQVLMACASLGLAALSHWKGPVPLAYAALALAGLASAVGRPARGAILRQLVPDHLVGAAVTWNSSGWQFASVAGPALGGAVIAVTGGATWAFLLAFLFALGVIFLFGSLRPTQVERATEPISLESLLAGLRFVRRTELLLATMTLDLFAVFLGGAVALLPVFAKDILQVGPVGLGWLRAAPSAGAVLMALTLTHWPLTYRAGPAMLWAVFGFGAATIGFGLSRNPYLSFLFLMMTGALDMVSVVVRSTLNQVLTPDSMRGRVGAVNSIFIGSSNELGGFESGMTARWFGPVASVVGGGVGTILVVLAVGFGLPGLRKLGSLKDVVSPDKPEPEDAEPALVSEARDG